MKSSSLTEEERRQRLRIPTGRLPLVIDTDAKNELDDQFAISWALRSPERFDVQAVYAAPFSQDCFRKAISGELGAGASKGEYADSPADGMEQSYEEILRLYGLLGMDAEGRVKRGSMAYLRDTGKAIESEAAQDLINRAMRSDGLLYVAAIGTPTNVASAILMEPELIHKIVVVWLGGQPLSFRHGMEFNLAQDVAAVRVLFDSGVPLVYVPCMNVASLLTLTEDEIRAKLLGKNPVCDYLAQNVLDAFSGSKSVYDATFFDRRSGLKEREDQPEEYLAQFAGNAISWSRIIWDVSTIAFLKNPLWCPSTLELSPRIGDDLYWKPIEPSRHSIRCVNYCYRDFIFGDMIACLTSL